MHPKQRDILPEFFRQIGAFLLGFAFGRAFQRFASSKTLTDSKQVTAEAVHTTHDLLQQEQERRDRNEQA